MTSSVHIDNKNKDILILGEEPTQGLYDNPLAAEAKYSIYFFTTKKKISIKSTIYWKQQFLIYNVVINGKTFLISQ